MLKENDFIEKNIELSSEFSRYLFEHPELSNQIPLDSELVLVPEFDTELRAFNLSLGSKIEAEGGKVTYVVIKNIHPKSYSRLTDVELKRAASC
jgi:hypothetical protein